MDGEIPRRATSVDGARAGLPKPQCIDVKRQLPFPPSPTYVYLYDTYSIFRYTEIPNQIRGEINNLILVNILSVERLALQQ
jgi:hypothetical protein